MRTKKSGKTSILHIILEIPESIFSRIGNGKKMNKYDIWHERSKYWAIDWIEKKSNYIPFETLGMFGNDLVASQ